MQQSLSTPLQPELDNRCPDCLSMILLGIPVPQEPPNDSLLLAFYPEVPQNSVEQIDLYLTLHFGEQREHLLTGSVTFGLKGGKLKLRLENASIPYEVRILDGLLELSFEKARQEQEGNQIQKGIEVSLSHTEPFEVGSQNQVNANISEFQVRACQVIAKASDIYPAWVFAEEMGNSVLRGLLNNAKLATLNVTAKPARVQATFEASMRDIHLIEVSGLWPPNISRNQRAVLERLIVLRVLEPKLKPYLSRQEWQYD